MVEATLHITRNLPNDIKIRGLRILLDGDQVADLAYGKDFRLQIQPGSHVLKVTNTLSSKEIKFEAKEGETSSFEAGNKMPGMLSWILTMGLSPYRVILNQL